MTQAPSRFEEVLEYLPQFKVVALKPFPDWRDGFMLTGTLRPFQKAGVEAVARMLDARVPIFLDTPFRG